MKTNWLPIAVLCAVLVLLQGAPFVRADNDGWSTSSLAGYNVQAVAIDPNNSDIIYVGTYQQGMLVSRDGGQSWRAIPELTGYITSILVHSENPDTLYVTTSGELMKSQDGGSSWTALGKNVLSGAFWVVAHPLQPDVMYVSTQNELFRSSDGGETWSGAGLPVAGTVMAVAFDPSNADVIYALQNQQGIFRTDDGGTSWALISEGLETSGYFNTKMGIDSSGSLVVQSHDGIWRTSNGGQSWQSVSLEGYSTYELQNTAFTVDSAQTGHIYLGLRNGILRSKDGGDSWTQIDEVLPYASSLLLTDPQKDNVLYALVNGQLYISDNGGDAWQDTKPDNWFLRLAAHPTEPGIVFGLRSGGYGDPWRSQDNMQSWELRNTGMEDVKVNTLVFSPIGDNVLYAGTETGLFRSMNGSGSWERTGLPANVQVSALAVDVQNADNLYAGGYTGLLRSTNGGESWTATSLTGSISSITVDSDTSRTVYVVANGNLHRSQDAGESWNILELGGQYITSVTLKPDDPSTIYVGAQDGLYISRDGGADWSRAEVQGGGGNFSPLVQTDPRRPEVLYAAWGPKVSISPDVGVNWYLLDQGAPVLDVADLDVDASDPLTLYITNEDGAGGVWQYTLENLPEPPTPTPFATATAPAPSATATTASALAQVDPEATAAQVFGLDAENSSNEGATQSEDTEGQRPLWPTVVLGLLGLAAIVAGGYFVWHRSQKPGSVVVSDSKFCPNCSATVPANARFCHKCGQQM